MGKEMKAQELIELLKEIPPDTPVRVGRAVLSTLKRIARENPAYMSDEEEDRLDLEMLAKRPKSDRKLHDWVEVKADLQRRGLL